MPEKAKIRIVMAEDHVGFRESFISFFDAVENFEVVGQAGNGLELIDLVEKHQPDIAIIDIEMPVMNGYEAMKTIVATYPKVKPIILSTYYDESFVSEILISGACAYIPKVCDMNEVIKTIVKVYTEGYYFNKEVSKLVVLDSSSNKVKFEKIVKQLALTEREIEVLKLVCNGNSNKEIGLTLNISYDTVAFHRNNIYRKTCSETIVDLVKYAIKNGITEIN